MYNERKVTALISAAGSGKRMGGPMPKQFMKIRGRTILETTVETFEKMNFVDEIIIISGEDFIQLCEELCRGFSKVKSVIAGGRERQDSVKAGINCIEGDGIVLIHDGVRPFVTKEVIEGVLQGVYEAGAAVPVVACKDTVRQTDTLQIGSVTLDRKTLFQVQTPQGFDLEIIRKAFEKADADGFMGTDDASLVERLGQKIALTEGSYENIKITTREDLPMDMRIGTGFDVHQLVEGRRLIMGGVDIPYEKGLLGHSDADVMVHALMDAMVGAAGLGDIGKHFPDTDPKYKGADSLVLLGHVNDLINDAGYVLGNADVTIIAQKPKMAPHIQQMRENIARVLKVDIARINVKATTTEKLGFTGRGEGIASEAVCLLLSR